MTTKNIDDLSAAGALSGTDKLMVAQGDAVLKRTTLTAVSNFILAIVRDGVAAAFDTLAEIATALAGKLAAASNLSDLADAGTARSNLGLGSSAVNASATSAEILAGTADKVIEADTMLSAMGPVALTDGASIAVDLATGVYFTVTLGGNRTLANPSNPKVGRTVYFKVAQDGTGSRTLSYGSQYDFGQDSAPTLSAAANAEDLLAFFVASTSKLVYLGIRKEIG